MGVAGGKRIVAKRRHVDEVKLRSVTPRSVEAVADLNFQDKDCIVASVLLNECVSLCREAF